MIAMRGAPIWPNAGAIRPRTRVARWVAEHGAARLWVLQAGPGAGKRATASLLAAAFGGPVFGFEATGDRPLASLTDDLGLPGDTAPERVAEALLARAAADWREGGVLVVRAADPGALANPTATAFARRWIASPPRGSIRTIVTTRWAIPWLPPRLVASGEAVVLGAPDLWFDTGEAADLLGDREVAAETLAATCGWPLAVASLARLAGKPGLRAFLEDLAAAELLDALPPDLRSAVAWLGPVPNWRSGDVPLDDPDLGRALERLIGWGLLVPGPAGEVAWHPLARPALNRLAGAGVAPADREARFRLMGEWLEARQPGRALDYWLAHGATAEAVACVARHGTSVPPSAARDREVAGLLERLPREVREADPHVLLAEGSLLLRRGSLGGAYDRLAAARRRFSATGAPAGEFASLARLLGVCLQRQAVAEGRAIAAAADDLAQQADLAELVVYRVNRGSLEFLAGDEEAALRAYRLALDVPHLGRKRAGLAQQEACLNVAILAQERGEYGQARRALLRALDLHADFPVDPSLPRRALLQIAMVLLAAGDREEGAAALERAGQAPAPEDGYHAALCGMLEGNALARLGKPEAAEASLRATLDALHRLGLDQSPDAAAALVVMADLSRQAGRPDAARLQLEWAEPLVGGLPRLRARLLHGRALLARAAGDLAAGRAALAEATSVLAGVVARPLAGTIALAAAVLADEAGDAGAAGRHLAAGVKLQREGPYPFLPASVPEIAPRLLRLLAAEGHGDLVAEVRSRYPHSVPEGETGEVGGHIAPRIEIRTFGRMQVRVGGAQVAFRRRKAPVLLAHLLQNPAGLSRDEAADLLFEDLAWEEARHQVDNLMSLLRRELGKDTGALRKEAGRYWLAPDAVWWDAREFDVAYGAGNAAWERGDRDQAGVHYAAALDCYAGDLFAGSEFAEWFEPARQAYRAGAISALERCGELELAQERFESARQRAERILEREPAHEGAHRLLMRIYAKLGEAGLVRRQFDACARSLERELDTAPSGETVALRDALLARA